MKTFKNILNEVTFDAKTIEASNTTKNDINNRIRRINSVIDELKIKFQKLDDDDLFTKLNMLYSDLFDQINVITKGPDIAPIFKNISNSIKQLDKVKKNLK